MHLLKALLIATVAQQAISIPLQAEPLRLLSTQFSKASHFSNSKLSTRQHLGIQERANSFSKCSGFRKRQPADEEAAEQAAEAAGCWILQDASNNDVRCALVDNNSLGKGAFGSVFKCQLEDGQDIAVKRYEKEDHVRYADTSWNILKDLSHENIVKIIAHGRIENLPAQAMEIIPDGDLEPRMSSGQYKGKENEQALKEVGNQLLNGFAYMHSKKVAHRDLREGNVMFSGNTVKIVDFDWAVKDEQTVERVIGGEYGLAAPEAIDWTAFDSTQQKPVDGYKIDPYGSDVWTLALLLIRLTTGQGWAHGTPSTPGGWERPEEFPNGTNPHMKSVWENDDADARVKLLKEKWPDFTQEFLELLGDIFCKQAQRIMMEQFKQDFLDVKIYC
ncbi:kinase-like protein [Lentithecium fluviatile CBS 122367]|uniref:Kinase-like protein n=1 Tax=Lentithecium fluviatile CBS 122367 TaxID=1168545 RepID=A0A6G1IUN6_9PLEO|nr:kinase-like protein [Lentithecium fluviatile CBS 122367]